MSPDTRRQAVASFILALPSYAAAAFFIGIGVLMLIHFRDKLIPFIPIIEETVSKCLICDLESARILLSTMAQIQVVILAILVSVSLVAIQLTAASYSSRVITIFRQHILTWAFFLILTFSALYDLFILKLLSQDFFLIHGHVSVNLAYFLGAIAFILIFPFAWMLSSITRPEKLVDKMCQTLYHSYSSKQPSDSSESFRSLLDLITMSASRRDYYTANVAIEKISDCLERFIKKSAASCKKKTRKHYRPNVAYLRCMESCEDIVKNYCDGMSLIEGCFVDAGTELAYAPVWAIRKIGFVICEVGLYDISTVIWYLSGLGNVFARNGLIGPAESAMNVLEGISSKLSPEILPEIRIDNELHLCASAIGSIGKVLVVEKSGSLQTVGELLGKAALRVAKRQAGLYCIEALRTFATLGMATTQQKYCNEITEFLIGKFVIEPIVSIGMAAHDVREDRNYGVIEAARAAFQVGMLATYRGLEKAQGAAARGVFTLKEADKDSADEGINMGNHLLKDSFGRLIEDSSYEDCKTRFLKICASPPEEYW